MTVERAYVLFCDAECSQLGAPPFEDKAGFQYFEWYDDMVESAKRDGWLVEPVPGKSVRVICPECQKKGFTV